MPRVSRVPRLDAVTRSPAAANVGFFNRLIGASLTPGRHRSVQRRTFPEVSTAFTVILPAAPVGRARVVATVEPTCWSPENTR